MTKISRSYGFEAAHRLQHHDGKCSNLHGHSYRVTVAIEGDILEVGPSEGMVLDFGHLNGWWKPLEALLDHATILEKTDPLLSVLQEYEQRVVVFHGPPTAENLATWLLKELQLWLVDRWPEGFPTPKVRVQETTKVSESWAEA